MCLKETVKCHRNKWMLLEMATPASIFWDLIFRTETPSPKSRGKVKFIEAYKQGHCLMFKQSRTMTSLFIS